MLIEIRIYTLVQGCRSEFVQLFDERLAPAQRAAGMDVIGQFTSNDDPNVFIWMRRFKSAEDREQKWDSFYGSSVWKEELAPIINPMIADASNVYLGNATPESRLR